ncbi:molybdate ABC transporter substrate-binding protein [Collibacillus ludicampi]|uniref:Molybdate ABC transporter substrate-binding protein n=1 Tax=Collibacillus ludicampi TaxID=2771369 RepID=A0AAV4LAZ7_9BACL|nr:molybdate ABC transporter substrate-binding protein [Collibacillus ludicampi]GIM44950.1 molybdate ABC transporter substrate-binding protein [Collibacillus ludicampi]
MSRYFRFVAVLVMIPLALSVIGCANRSSSLTQQNGTKNSSQAVELYILAAASLSDALKEAQRVYESSRPGVKLVFSFGASGTLQHQIEQGAPADLFLSAGTKEMDDLVEKGIIDSENRSDLLGNELVLIVPKTSHVELKSIRDLTKSEIKKIAIGKPETVPAGSYAKQSLSYNGIWDFVQSKLVFAKDVRQVLAYVETGNVDAGIVYKTDATSSDRVSIAAIAEPNSHKPIVYPLGLIKNSKHSTQARDLYDWLQGPEAKAIFTKYGFEMISQKLPSAKKP